MGKIYVNQDFKITLKTEQDITGATSVKIKYKKPDGVLGEWTASIVDPVLGIIEYNVLDTENTVIGNLTVWAKIVTASGLNWVGEPETFTIYKEGF